MVVQKILSLELSPTNLICVKLPNTRSQIVRQNGYVIHCFSYYGLGGLFRKDVQETYEFGRRLCDEVACKNGNRGFFSSDELPRYGLSRKEKELIRQEATADFSRDLVIILAYTKIEAERTKETLNQLLEREKQLILATTQLG